MFKDFSSTVYKGIVGVSLVLATGCTTVPSSGLFGTTVGHDFGKGIKKEPCTTEFNTTSHILKVSLACTGKQVQEAREFYKGKYNRVNGVSVIRP